MWVERVYWTLFVEAGFYLMIFLLLAFDRFNDIARVATCLGIISLVYWTLFFASLHYIFPGSEWLRGSAFKRYLDLSLIHHGPWFALGINVWLAQRTGYGARAVSILIAVIGGCLQGAHHSLFETKLEPMYEIAFSLVGFMCVAGAACHHTRFTVNNVTASLYRKIGIATYPLYLLHDYIGKKIIYDSGLFPSSAGKVAASCVIAALMVWLALTIAGVVEPVVKTWFLRSFDRFQDTLKRTQKVDFVFRRSTPLQPL
jgi:peptidoglycan/LPS O-acetylase OafA/YrhL